METKPFLLVFSMQKSLDLSIGRESLGNEIKIPFLEREDREKLLRHKCKSFTREITDEEIKEGAKILQGKSVQDIVVLMQIS